MSVIFDHLGTVESCQPVAKGLDPGSLELLCPHCYVAIQLPPSQFLSIVLFFLSSAPFLLHPHLSSLFPIYHLHPFITTPSLASSFFLSFHFLSLSSPVSATFPPSIFYRSPFFLSSLNSPIFYHSSLSSLHRFHTSFFPSSFSFLCRRSFTHLYFHAFFLPSLPCSVFHCST